MATNKIQDGNVLRLPVGSTVKSGDPVVVGTALHGVALTDYAAADGKASVEMGGVYKFSVKAVDGAGNSAIAIGDRLYYVTGDTPQISKKVAGAFFGIALGAVAPGGTASIDVLIAPATRAPDGSSHRIIAAGIHVVASTNAVEEITVTGALATDIVLATMSVNGSTVKNILSAIASDNKITITASGNYVSGDKINYAVLRIAV